MTPQPLIAVRDVQVSGLWYQAVLGLTSGHGGAEYERLMHDGRMVMQLHHWDAHEHPHLGDANAGHIGNGVLLWFQTANIDEAHAHALVNEAHMLEPLKFNPSAGHREFWLRDPDGYVVVVAGIPGETV